jgi:hypothetical protein
MSFITQNDVLQPVLSSDQLEELNYAVLQYFDCALCRSDYLLSAES